MMATRRRSGGTPVTGTPSMHTSPRAGVWTPLTMRHSVDFPAPDGPVMPRISPGPTVRLTSSSA